MSCKLYRFMILVGIAGSVASGFSQTTYTLQVGAYQDRESAQGQLDLLHSRGYEATFIDENPHQPQGYIYRVKTGDYPTRAAADAAKAKMWSADKIESFVVTDGVQIDTLAARRVLEDKTLKFFRNGVAPTTAADYSGRHDETVHNLRLQVFEMPTTAPETLTAMRNYIDLIPDNHPLKGREIREYASRTLAASENAYSKERPRHKDLQALLSKVANKEVPATQAEQNFARERLVTLLHYYEQDYLSAIPGYRELIAADRQQGNHAALAMRNADLAGAIYELGVRSNLSTTETVTAILEVWNETNEIRQAYIDDTTTTGSDIRKAVARIDLMLTEQYLDAKAWDEAEELANNFMETYGQYEDCKGYVAETWCHLARVYCSTQRYELANQAADNAIKTTEEYGKAVWGRPLGDPLAKGYAWKYNIAQVQKKFDERDRIAAEIRNRFPKDHPVVHKYGLLHKVEGNQ